MANKRMTRSNIGYVGEDGVKPYGWNPGGFSCSAKCPECWSREFVGRGMVKCQKCIDNVVHLHEERLVQPANTKKPGVVLVNFTCDTFDEKRPDSDIMAVVCGIAGAIWHEYVLLTKQPQRMAEWEFTSQPQGEVHGESDNVWKGLTIRNQADADEKLPVFLEIPGNKWLSMEPLWGHADALSLMRWRTGMALSYGASPPIAGAIIGHDNRRNAPGSDTLAHIRFAVKQCQAAEMSVFIKQLWQDGELLRASHPDEFAKYPEDLKLRDLPWSNPA